MDRYGRSLQFCHLEFDKEAFSDDCIAHSGVLREGRVDLSDFRELSFCGYVEICIGDK